MTASGSDQLSYCAASTRNTKTTASGKTNVAVLPAALLVGDLGPLEAEAVTAGWRRARSIGGNRLTREKPGVVEPWTSAAGTDCSAARGKVP